MGHIVRRTMHIMHTAPDGAVRDETAGVRYSAAYPTCAERWLAQGTGYSE